MAIDTKYKSAIKTAALAAAGVGGPGMFFPVLDTAAVAAIWTTMVLAIAERSGHPMTKATTAKSAAAALGACSAYLLGSKILTWAAAPLLVMFPLAGIPMVTSVNVIRNGLFTYRLGSTCARNFDHPDFNSEEFLSLGADLFSDMISMPSLAELRGVKELLFD